MICRVKPQTDRLGMYVSTGRRHSVPEIELPENIEWIDDEQDNLAAWTIHSQTRTSSKRIASPSTPKAEKKGIRDWDQPLRTRFLNGLTRLLGKSVVISVMCVEIQFSCPQVDLWLMNLHVVVGYLILHVPVSNARGKPYTYRFQNRILLSIHLIFIHSNDVRFPLRLDCVIRFSG